MKYIYQQGKTGQPTFVLLHGTGGTEEDLLGVAQELNPDYNVLSIRGKVSENGMNRYFKRLSEGNFDLEDLDFRGEELLNFIKKVGKEKDFELSDCIFVGFSNGANIALNLLLREEAPYKKAILFHPMYPVTVENKTNLSQLNVFISAGKQDPLVSLEETQHVIDLLSHRGAQVATTWTMGHQLTYEELSEAKKWLAT